MGDSSIRRANGTVPQIEHRAVDVHARRLWLVKGLLISLHYLDTLSSAAYSGRGMEYVVQLATPTGNQTSVLSTAIIVIHIVHLLALPVVQSFAWNWRRAQHDSVWPVFCKVFGRGLGT